MKNRYEEKEKEKNLETTFSLDMLIQTFTVSTQSQFSKAEMNSESSKQVTGGLVNMKEVILKISG